MSQVDLLRYMDEELKNIPEIVRKNVQKTPTIGLFSGVVSGAGDSFAVALMAEAFSRGLLRAVDPLDALIYDIKPDVLVAISVGGRTSALIDLANKLKKTSTKIIAITSNVKSPLARVADELYEINYKPISRPMPGITSFFASISKILALIGFEIDHRALEYEEKLELGNERLIFVGDNAGYGISYYSALKIYEIFGEPARYDRLEQFCHANLYSVTSSGESIIFYPFNYNKYGKLIKLLLKYKFNFYTIANNEYDPITRPFRQVKTFLEALNRRVHTQNILIPHFLKDKNLLKDATELIYTY